MVPPQRLARYVSLLLLLVASLPRGGALPVTTKLSKIFGDVCGFPLGVDILDSEITASSSLPGNEAPKSRFDRGLPGWRAAKNDVEEWIEVELPTKMPVTGILTQGLPGQDIFIKEYKVEYSLDEQHWSCVLDMHSQPKEFEGNIDDSTPKLNKFRPAVQARFIRIRPLQWEGAIGMILEIFGGGCKDCWEKKK